MLEEQELANRSRVELGERAKAGRRWKTPGFVGSLDGEILRRFLNWDGVKTGKVDDCSTWNIWGSRCKPSIVSRGTPPRSRPSLPSLA